jgi:CBS domain-containing protein
MPNEMTNIHQNLRFDEVRFNFYNAARNGMEANFHWFGKRYNATDLIKKIFLPIAIAGLEKAKVNKQDIDKYISVIEGRLQKDSTGASWTTKNFTQLLDNSSAGEAAIGITKHLIENSETEIPVHKWKNISPSKKPKEVLKEVYQIMETDLVTAKEDDLLEFLINMMEWRKIRHVPIENDQHELVGIVTSRCLVKYFRSPNKNKLNAVADIMQTKVFTADAHTPIIDAIRIMGENKIGCLPIIADNKLVGIITERDILKFAGVQNNVW